MNSIFQFTPLSWRFFSLPQKPTTVHLEIELRAEVENEANARGKKLSGFLASIIQKTIRLEFLDPANRAFVLSVLHEVGGPWHALDVINALVTAARREIAAGRLRPAIWSGQIESVQKSDAPRSARMKAEAK
jgi:hypothetical protein